MRWHDCPTAKEARRLKQLECTRDWRERHPGYQAEHKKNPLLEAPKPPNHCRRCGALTRNRYYCSDCWEVIEADADVVEHCLGQELGSIWL